MLWNSLIVSGARRTDRQWVLLSCCGQLKMKIISQEKYFVSPGYWYHEDKCYTICYVTLLLCYQQGLVLCATIKSKFTKSMVCIQWLRYDNCWWPYLGVKLLSSSWCFLKITLLKRVNHTTRQTSTCIQSKDMIKMSNLWILYWGKPLWMFLCAPRSN